MPFNQQPQQSQTPPAMPNAAAAELDQQVYALVEAFRQAHPEFVVWYDLKVKPAPAKIAAYTSKHHTTPLTKK